MVLKRGGGATRASSTIKVSLVDRVHTRLTARSGQVTGFVYQPEPRSGGSFARGRQLLSGNFQFGGHLVRQPSTAIWDLVSPDHLFEAEIHGFGWLDDLAAVSDGAARVAAQTWLLGWITHYGNGVGPGWSPDLTGRRLIRWITHALFLLNGQSAEDNRRYFKSLSQQTAYLARSWPKASPGLPKFEALTGLLYAGLSLSGLEDMVETAANALAVECDTQIGANGGLPTRNPEELMEVLTLLRWADALLRDVGRTPAEAHGAAITRIVPTLQSLRHANGGLAAFHGCAHGVDIKMDRVLAEVADAVKFAVDLPMGYARLNAEQTTVIADVAAPPKGKAALNAHAGTLAFELTSARRPVIVNCGAGMNFGPDWHRAGRATPSHSTLAIDGVSSAQLTVRPDGEPLVGGPNLVTAHKTSGDHGSDVLASHNAYLKDYGLMHSRRLSLSQDGRVLQGEDTLSAATDAQKLAFDKHMDRIALEGVPFSIRFHLHPDVEASVDMGGNAVSLMLKNEEIWVFRPVQRVELALKRSVYLEKGRLNPRPTQQVILSSRAMEYATHVSWVLAKARDVPSHMREAGHDALAPG
jgi:uncharacterized heparinase superfamily protein